MLAYEIDSSPAAEQNQRPRREGEREREREISRPPISEKACVFFSPHFTPFSLLLSGNEQMVINVRRVNLPSLRQVFPSWYSFLRTRQEMKFLCVLYNPPAHPLSTFFFIIRISFFVKRGKKGPLSIFKKREELQSNNMPHGWRSNRVVPIYRIIWCRTDFLNIFFS